MDVILAIVGLAIAASIYLIPSIIAHKKNHKQKIPIMLVNIILGWSLVGWACALIWCFISPIEVTQKGLSEEIEKLHKLKCDGILTEEEFQRKKEALLK